MGTGKKLRSVSVSFTNESSHVQCDKLSWPEISDIAPRSGMQWVSETNIATRFTEKSMIAERKAWFLSFILITNMADKRT